MFILNYFNLKPNHALDAVSKQHIAFMERHVAAGTLLAAGAKVPRTGGIMIAQGVDRAAIEALVAMNSAASGMTNLRMLPISSGLAMWPVQPWELSAEDGFFQRDSNKNSPFGGMIH